MTMMRKPVELLSRLPRPQTTVRWRLTLLYGVLFLGCGAALLAITYALVADATKTTGDQLATHLFPSIPSGSLPPQAKEAESYILSYQRIADLHQLEIESGIALAIMAIASMLLGWVVAGRVLRPLRTITATTRQISDTNLHRRLAMGGPRDELRELSETIDGLLARLATAFEAQRRFVANASHELRTPLAMMRTTLDVAVAKPGGVPAQTRALDADLRLDLDHAEELLESFLLLSRAQHHELGDQGLVALEQLIAAALASRADEIAASQITVHTALTPIRVRGSETLLARMVENVIENAVRYNQRHGSIRVVLARDGDDGRLVIESAGVVLDDAAVAQLAQPFRRLGEERTGPQNGHGLGLSIVASIAEAHGGALDLHALPQGGLRVQLTLPAVTVAHTSGRRS
ncbi:MAG: sensor histidine kinase [Solirubrobacteraceae bacterium]